MTAPNSSAIGRLDLLQEGVWTKSKRSNSGMACVEVLATGDGQVHIRDSKYRREERGPVDLEPMLSVIREEFDRLIEIVSGNPDVTLKDLVLRHEPDGDVTLGTRTSNETLRFSQDEWLAFGMGAKENEFDESRMPVHS